MISENRGIVTIEEIDDFDPDQIFDCGQCFRFYKQPDGSYTGVAHGRVINVSVKDEDLESAGRFDPDRISHSEKDAGDKSADTTIYGKKAMMAQNESEIYASESRILKDGESEIYASESRILKDGESEAYAAESRTNKNEYEDYASKGRLLKNGAPEACEGTDNKTKKSGKKTLIIKNTTEEDVRNIWNRYFDLDTDYGKIKKELMNKDEVIGEAIEHGEGIRILRQDIWETVVSFIISQNNNIPRIRKCIEALAENFGEKVKCPSELKTDVKYEGNHEYISECTDEQKSAEYPKLFSIPGPEVLASLTEEDLAVCRLGYRAKYLIATGKKIAEDKGKTLRALAMGEGSDKEAIEYLKSLPGVGPKVAGCIALFGMGRKSAFPVDVWVKRVMNWFYGFDEDDVKGISGFAAERFGEFGGVAQQYLFYYMRYVM